MEGGEIIVYYDGACILCTHYADFMQLRKKHTVIVRDARTHHIEIKQLAKQGYNINQGIIIQKDSTIYQGAEPLLYFHGLINNKKKRYTGILLYISSAAYSCVNAGRKLLLPKEKKSI